MATSTGSVSLSSPLVMGTVAAAAALPALYLARRTWGGGGGGAPKRQRRVAATEERVCILGASSGVGRALARLYAARGARVCVVARRAELLDTLVRECGGGDGDGDEDRRCLSVVADAAQPDDMVRVRDALLDAWGGLDTLHLCAGVSALQPVLALARTTTTGPDDADADADPAGVRAAVDIAARATQGNFVGPLVVALTLVRCPPPRSPRLTRCIVFAACLASTPLLINPARGPQIPMLQRTSAAPAILLVSSLAAVVGAPTRALYAATKASSLLLYQSLAIEHPRIAFSFVLPSTIEGDFRASAVDAGPVREDDPNKTGLKIADVAARCVDAVDRRVTGNTFLPRWPYFLAPLIYTLWPSYVEKQARKKYHWEEAH